jgi:hypothetical protein
MNKIYRSYNSLFGAALSLALLTAGAYAGEQNGAIKEVPAHMTGTLTVKNSSFTIAPFATAWTPMARARRPAR